MSARALASDGAMAHARVVRASRSRTLVRARAREVRCVVRGVDRHRRRRARIVVGVAGDGDGGAAGAGAGAAVKTPPAPGATASSAGDGAGAGVRRSEVVRATVATAGIAAGVGAERARRNATPVGAAAPMTASKGVTMTREGGVVDVAIGRVVAGDTVLDVRRNGAMTLFKRDGSGAAQTLVAGVTAGASVVRADVLANGREMKVFWSDGTMLRAVATMELTTEGSEDAWCRGITDGVLLEVNAPLDASNGAELTINLCDDVEKTSHWYGGAHTLTQLWPMERAKIETGPLYPFDHGPNGVGSVVATHWVSSSGALVFADPNNAMLHFGMNSPTESRARGSAPRYFGVGIQNLSRPSLPVEESTTPARGDGVLRLQSRANYSDAGMLHPWQNIRTEADMRSSLKLRVAVALEDDARSATREALKQLPKPDAVPADALVYKPIWTTWATAHADVTQESTLSFAKEILAAQKAASFANGSIIEIDDRWQCLYGELDFDAKKFPDPKGMVKQLHDMGFLVTVWVMPFLQEGSPACEEAKRLGYLMEGSQPPTEVGEIFNGNAGFGQILGTAVKVVVDRVDWPPGHWEGGGGGADLQPGQFRWWGTQPVRGIDFTNEDACEWFVSRLKHLQEDIGLDGFKFDAGEPCFMPYGAKTRVPLKTPQEYSQLYVDKVVSKFPISEVRVAMGTNDYRGLVRMGDKDTVWGTNNGLQSLIPTLLTSAVMGYPFTLPDIIGGNAYWGQSPDSELMARWAQASAFMPAVQYSIPPWQISEEAQRASDKALQMRETLLVPRLKALMEDARDRLEPICQPLWWLTPDDPETFTIDDQFAVGRDIIVAPVVYKGASYRRVYLPRGSWREYESATVLNGERWITVAAPLEKLPVFVRVS